MIGCNFWDDLPAKSGSIYPGFWLKRDKKLFDGAKPHYFVFLTGSKDFNQEGTIKAYKGYLKDGFKNCFYNETPDLGHATPPAGEIEKGFAFLDCSLRADAFAAAERAAKAKKGKQYAKAADLLAQHRGSCAAVDDLWRELTELAESETESAMAAKVTKLRFRRDRLKAVIQRFGVLATRARKELETLEASPEYQAETAAAKARTAR